MKKALKYTLGAALALHIIPALVMLIGVGTGYNLLERYAFGHLLNAIIIGAIVLFIIGASIIEIIKWCFNIKD